jgi:hypothetical protein
MKLATAEVSFNHFRKEQATVCTVVVRNKIFQGIAKCSPEDKFSRDTGRKISLSKAMKKTSGELSKVQRRNVWNAYRDMTKDPRW